MGESRSIADRSLDLAPNIFSLENLNFLESNVASRLIFDSQRSIQIPSLASNQSTMDFKCKLSYLCPYYLELVVGMFIWCFGPLGLNSLEGVAQSSWSQAINILLMNPPSKEDLLLAWSASASR